MSMVKIRPIKKWVSLQGISDELADDTLALEAYTASLYEEGMELVRGMNREPTGQNSADLMKNHFPGMSRDPYNHRLRVVVRYYGAEEEVDEDELVS